jgi:hypothetical protein
MTCASKPWSWTSLTKATLPAGVFVLHSNQPLEQAKIKRTLEQNKKNQTNLNPGIQISLGIT